MSDLKIQTELEEENLTMADLMAEVDKTMARIYRGDIKKATVIAIEEKGLILNIGYHADAVMNFSEYSADAVDKSTISIGDEFKVTVLKLDDGEGNVVVSKKRADNEKSYEEIEQMFKNKQVITVRLKEVTKGGLITNIKGVRAFIPGSQITDTYVEDLKTYVGKDVEVQIIEFEPRQRKLILSGKAIAKQKRIERRKDRLTQLKENEKYIGTVTKLMNYGAFVDLDGVEGLVHNSDLSWQRIKHPSDVVKEGEKVEVTIISINAENGKIALAIKDRDNDPWQLAINNLSEGQVIKGVVTKFMPFGAFVKIFDGVEGLVHISQISTKRINKPEEVLELNQEIEVKVIKIDKQDKKISLSITAVAEQVDDELKKTYMA
ncbi:MAG: 30S ribosomal protein S1 [Epulopiscium sp. Nuni2H_MBin003]|nr:MAG: 30S ribosomal protein S1 [Epulopiscium sp. Nuni2H_MBin003]